MTDLLTAPPQVEDRLDNAGSIGRGQQARRIHRVLAELLRTDRWPAAHTLGSTLVPLTGTVLKQHPLSKPDRAAAIKVAGGAATYCWEYLPEPTWSWRPELAADAARSALPLVWTGPSGQVVADVLLAGLQRTPLETGTPLAAELCRRAAAQGTHLDAVRLLTLAAPARSLLLTSTPEVPGTPGAANITAHPHGTASFAATALDDSPYAGIGGLRR